MENRGRPSENVVKLTKWDLDTNDSIWKYDMDKFVTKVTAEKPRAVAYVDDKGITFTDWKQTLRELNSSS